MQSSIRFQLMLLIAIYKKWGQATFLITPVKSSLSPFIRLIF